MLTVGWQRQVTAHCFDSLSNEALLNMKKVIIFLMLPQPEKDSSRILQILFLVIGNLVIAPLLLEFKGQTMIYETKNKLFSLPIFKLWE